MSGRRLDSAVIERTATTHQSVAEAVEGADVVCCYACTLLERIRYVLSRRCVSTSRLGITRERMRRAKADAIIITPVR